MKSYIHILIVCLLTMTSCVEYVIEKEGVYYKDWNEARGSAKRLLTGADPETFEVLTHESYAKDKNLVFYQGSRINGADASTFVSLGDLYAKDKFRGYYAGDSIECSRGAGFRIIDSYYSTDGSDVFYTTQPLHVCSTEKFRFVYTDGSESEWERWTTDGCFYYFKNYQIPSNDYQQVQLFKGSAGFAKDSSWVYYLNRKINYTSEGEKIIDTVDVTSFTVTGYIDCKDKFGCINPYHGREKCE